MITAPSPFITLPDRRSSGWQYGWEHGRLVIRQADNATRGYGRSPIPRRVAPPIGKALEP